MGVLSYRALAHLFAREFEEAAHWSRRATQLPNAHHWSHTNLASALGHLGDEARTDMHRLKLRTHRDGTFADVGGR